MTDIKRSNGGRTANPDIVVPVPADECQHYESFDGKIVLTYVHPNMCYTIFQQEVTRQTMVQLGISFVDNPHEAQLLVANHEEFMFDLVSKFGATKKYLLWMHEPRYFLHGQKWTGICGHPVRTISLQSGEIYRDNYYYSEIALGNHSVSRKEATADVKKRIICIAKAATKTGNVLKSRGKGMDLMRLRTEIALVGYKMGIIDIYGKRWPSGVSKGDSRSGNWSVAKYKILLKYHFNLCFENTLFPYYCSEKIWQSIYCGCLPIYYGQTSIYEDFPRQSFIDYAELGTPEALFKKIFSMNNDEFADRYNKCFEVYRRAQSHGNQSRQYAAKYAMQQIRQLMNDTNAISVPET